MEAGLSRGAWQECGIPGQLPAACIDFKLLLSFAICVSQLIKCGIPYGIPSGHTSPGMPSAPPSYDFDFVYFLVSPDGFEPSTL